MPLDAKIDVDNSTNEALTKEVEELRETLLTTEGMLSDLRDQITALESTNSRLKRRAAKKRGAKKAPAVKSKERTDVKDDDAEGLDDGGSDASCEEDEPALDAATLSLAVMQTYLLAERIVARLQWISPSQRSPPKHNEARRKAARIAQKSLGGKTSADGACYFKQFDGLT